MMSHSDLQNKLNHFNITVRKMAVKIQYVEMQSASFWTGRYQNIYDVEY